MGAGFLNGLFGGGLSDSSSAASTLSNSTPFYAPSNFTVGSGSASSAGDIGTTSQNPSANSSASAALSPGLPPSGLLAPSGSTSSILLITIVGGVAVALVVAFLHLGK